MAYRQSYRLHISSTMSELLGTFVIVVFENIPFLLVFPPVEVAQASMPFESRATAPTVPLGRPWRSMGIFSSSYSYVGGAPF